MSQYLGFRAKDRVSGLEGIITGHTVFLFGCERVLISPEKGKPDGSKMEDLWMDVPQIEVISDKPIIEPRRLNAPIGHFSQDPGPGRPTR